MEMTFGPKPPRDDLRFEIVALIEFIQTQSAEINLLSGRVDLTLRLLSRLVAKIDPAYLDNPNDPEVRRKSKLLGDAVLAKMKSEALAQAAHDPVAFDLLKRYFKDTP